MKKLFERMTSITLGVMALIFIIFTLAMIFNTRVAEEANNGVVQALFGIFAFMFVALSAVNIWSAFSERDKIKQILLFKTKDSVNNASVSVIRKMAKKVVAGIECVKLRHINLFIDNNNEAIMKAAVKISATDKEGELQVAEILDKVYTALKNEYSSILGFEFKTIELKLTSIKEAKKPKPEETKVEQKTIPAKEERVKPVELQVFAEEEATVEDEAELVEA